MSREQLTAGEARVVADFDQRLKLGPNPPMYEPGHTQEMELLTNEIIAISTRVGLAGDELLAAAQAIIREQQNP